MSGYGCDGVDDYGAEVATRMLARSGPDDDMLDQGDNGGGRRYRKSREGGGNPEHRTQMNKTPNAMNRA